VLDLLETLGDRGGVGAGEGDLPGYPIQLAPLGVDATGPNICNEAILSLTAQERGLRATGTKPTKKPGAGSETTTGPGACHGHPPR
jgi:hypothetical protein